MLPNKDPTSPTNHELQSIVGKNFLDSPKIERPAIAWTRRTHWSFEWRARDMKREEENIYHGDKRRATCLQSSESFPRGGEKRPGDRDLVSGSSVPRLQTKTQWFTAYIAPTYTWRIVLFKADVRTCVGQTSHDAINSWRECKDENNAVVWNNEEGGEKIEGPIELSRRRRIFHQISNFRRIFQTELQLVPKRFLWNRICRCRYTRRVYVVPVGKNSQTCQICEETRANSQRWEWTRVYILFLVGQRCKRFKEASM